MFFPIPAPSPFYFLRIFSYSGIDFENSFSFAIQEVLHSSWI